jgi:hypothetical protein
MMNRARAMARTLANVRSLGNVENRLAGGARPPYLDDDRITDL